VAIFSKLRAMRAFEKKHLHFLRTVEDFELIHAIGYQQEIGEPMTMKQIYLLGVASAATVQRRLRHLREHGAIQLARSKADGRAVELFISRKLQKTCAKYVELMALGGTDD
jgi:Fic family protein